MQGDHLESLVLSSVCVQPEFVLFYLGNTQCLMSVSITMRFSIGNCD